MPQELEALNRMRQSQMLAAALPAVQDEIAEMVRAVDATIVGAVRGKRLTAEDAIAYCHQKAALVQLRDRLTQSVEAGKRAGKSVNMTGDE